MPITTAQTAEDTTEWRELGPMGETASEGVSQFPRPQSAASPLKPRNLFFNSLY